MILRDLIADDSNGFGILGTYENPGGNFHGAKVLITRFLRRHPSDYIIRVKLTQDHSGMPPGYSFECYSRQVKVDLTKEKSEKFDEYLKFKKKQNFKKDKFGNDLVLILHEDHLEFSNAAKAYFGLKDSTTVSFLQYCYEDSERLSLIDLHIDNEGDGTHVVQEGKIEDKLLVKMLKENFTNYSLETDYLDISVVPSQREGGFITYKLSFSKYNKKQRNFDMEALQADSVSSEF